MNDDLDFIKKNAGLTETVVPFNGNRPDSVSTRALQPKAQQLASMIADKIASYSKDNQNTQPDAAMVILKEVEKQLRVKGQIK